MSQRRFTERQADVQRSLSRLKEAASLPESDVIRDAVIQRFEFTFEIFWKTLKLHLEHQGHECSSPRETIRVAYNAQMIKSMDQADLWIQMLDDRNLTSHTYDEALSIRIYRHIADIYIPILDDMQSTILSLIWE